MKNIIYILVFIFASVCVNAQTETDQQLAAQYFKNGEFEKSSVLYERMYKKTKDEFFFDYFVRSLMEVEDFEAAEKVISKRLKKEKLPVLGVRLGDVMSKSGDERKAQQLFEKVIKELPPIKPEIDKVSEAFMSIGKMDFAIATLKKGRSILKGEYGYGYELAELYGKKGEFGQQLGQYFAILEFNPREVKKIQPKLLDALADDPNEELNDFFQQEVIDKIQTSPGVDVHVELLIWHYMQKKEFSNAFFQAKALDKRNREDGARIIDISQTATANRDYDLAVKGYKYVIRKGEDNYFYFTAKMDLLDALDRKVTESEDYTSADLEELEQLYTKDLEDLGRNVNSLPLLRGLAKLYVFYMDRVADGIDLLYEAKDVGGITRLDEAKVKVELADALLFSGEIWEATLLYSQAEKSYKNDELGRMAKLKNAKLAYYTGQFDWAQAQLNVLKSATSQFIANDALYLAMLISDNIAFDTVYTALEMFARADLLLYRNQVDSAMASLDSIDQEFPGHALADEVMFKRAQIAMKRRDFEGAADLFHQVWKTYTFDLLADDALYQLAILTEEKLGKPEDAMEYYQEILLSYPGSLFTVDARKRFRELRGDLLN
ncbi:MAG: tetratricopeptide (TPR) repeat protein [Granulosicoccus sp.]